MEIQDIKSRLTIQEVLHHYNLTPDKNSRFTCPWHNDTTPSLQVYLKTNTWTCFSSKCTAGSGDVIDFVMKYENLSKHEAIQKCKELSGYEPSQQGKSLERIAKSTSEESVSTSPMLFEEQSRQSVLSKFYSQLQYAPSKAQHAPVKTYLESRGIEGVAVAYCSGRSLSDWKRRSKDWHNSIEAYGLSRFRESLVFAMRNRSNQIIGLYGRKLKDSESGNHYYLNGPHQGLYPSWPSVETKRLILTESIIDAASLLELEGYAVLALYGTKGFTQDHVAAISSLVELEEVILFMDGDEPGGAAIVDLLEKLQEVNDTVTISKVNTPSGTDPNSLLQTEGLEKIAQLIEEREFIYSIEKRSIEKEEASIIPTRKLDATRQDHLIYESEKLRIQIIGGIKITNLEKLRVTLKVESKEPGDDITADIPVRESLDLYQGRQVEQLLKRMSEDMQLNHNEAMQIISDLTNELELYRSDRIELLKIRKGPQSYQMNESSRQVAMTYLKDPNLIANTIADITKSGIIGERDNALIGYIVYMSRKREKPLHVMYLGKSGSGKTYLQEKLAELIPEEDKKSVTALSDQSLYYQGKQLKGKVLFIEDIDGAENVMYIIRELQTKGWVMKTVVWKDPQGNMEPKDVLAEGPLSISSCTTHERIYEDNANRCILLYIDDSAAQDKRIMEYQKRLSAGLVKKHDQAQIRKLHQNVQRLLRPIEVINPYAIHIDLPQEVFKPRRTLQILLGFIETVTYYHQYQREQKREEETGKVYIETTVEDIELSFELLKEVLFRKSDELSEGCRRFLEKLKEKKGGGSSFYSKEVRKEYRLHPSKIKRYLGELVEYGYIKILNGNRYRGYEYQIVDYEEYNKLRGQIEERLEAIIKTIKGLK